MSWESIFLIIGFVLLVLFIRTLGDRVKRIIGIVFGVLFVIMLFRNAPEVIALGEKYTDTLWPVVRENSERLIDKFGQLLSKI